MANKKDNQVSNDRLAALATQGRTWKFTEQVARYKRPQILLDPPMEITTAMLHGLRMVDEIVVVVQGHAPTIDSANKVKKGGR